MKNEVIHQKKFLKDYQKPSHTITHTDLYFHLCGSVATVTSSLEVRKEDKSCRFLSLVGSGMELLSVSVDGKKLSSDTYEVSTESLTIPSNSEKMQVEIITKIDCDKNLTMEGLYISGDKFITQCEPEGFRRITYFLDRPDVLSTYTVTVEADQEKYPILLSNGNYLSSGKMEGERHWVTWKDPIPKPSYLFALVAGSYDFIEDSFTTSSGRNVKLSIYTEHGKKEKARYAMESLINSMKWDEDVYGFECDLDHYKIVCAADFNMGAMENKGLNIFNDSLTLADPKTTTDANYKAIESVVAHEYFHNWTGNRVTCRDWFQLCLKEGLTIFRDQEFSRFMNSPSVCRIEDINVLRSSQFQEDLSPVAHPPRPSEYIEMNNFYTSTVYLKGAECVRMLYNLLGKKTYFDGIKNYIKRFDGKAVTQEDFIDSMEKVSGRSLKQFFLWYTEAGLPTIEIKDHYDVEKSTYRLELTQHLLEKNGCRNNTPRHIPCAVSLISEDGKVLPFKPSFEEDVKPVTNTTFEMTDIKQTFTLSEVQQRPIPSLFENLSAPVNVVYDYTDQDLLTLILFGQDGFSRWDACQKFYLKSFLKLIKSYDKKEPLVFSHSLTSLFTEVLNQKFDDLSLQAYLLSLPVNSLILQKLDEIHPESIIAVRKFLKKEIGSRFYEKFSEIYENNLHSNTDQYNGKDASSRALKNVCLFYMKEVSDSRIIEVLWNQFSGAKNMTDYSSAFHALCDLDCEEKYLAIEQFHSRYKNDPLVLNTWFRAQALSSQDDTFTQVNKLFEHPSFSKKNPNHLRSLLSSFCHNNFEQFHNIKYSTYEFCRQKVLQIDNQNPLIAANILKSLIQWKKFEKNRKKIMKKELDYLNQQKLSNDVYEILQSALK